MRIRKTIKGNYYWEDYIDDKRVRRENSKWKTQKEVRAAHKEFISSIDSGETVDNPIFRNVLEEYIQVYAITKKQSSVIRIRYLINSHIEPYFGNHKIKSIDLRLYQKFQQHLLDKTYSLDGEQVNYTDEYMKSIQSFVVRLMNFAVQYQYISRNPLQGAPYATRNEFKPKKQFTILTNEQYNQFIEGVTNPGHRIIFSILYWCGLRSGELMALNIKDIDLENKELHVYKNYDSKNGVITTTKTNKDRFVDIPDKCMDDIYALIEYAKSENIEGNFHLIGLNKIMSKTQMSRVKQEAIDIANMKYNIPYFTFHELRHTHVSTLLDLGSSAKDVADRLGHSVEMVNNTYGHLFPERRRKILDQLNGI